MAEFDFLSECFARYESRKAEEDRRCHAKRNS